MSGQQVFEQIVVLSDQAGRIVGPITADDYEQWRHDYICRVKWLGDYTWIEVDSNGESVLK